MVRRLLILASVTSQLAKLEPGTGVGGLLGDDGLEVICRGFEVPSGQETEASIEETLGRDLEGDGTFQEGEGSLTLPLPCQTDGQAMEPQGAVASACDGAAQGRFRGIHAMLLEQHFAEQEVHRGCLAAGVEMAS